MDDKDTVNNQSVARQLVPSRGKDFESLVAELYRALGDRIETNIRLDGQEIDIFASRYLEGIGPVAFLIECKDWSNPVGNQEVQKFIQTVSALRASGRIQSGVMVSRSGFTPDAKAAASPITYVNLLTPDELEHVIFDPTFGARRLVAEYKTQTIFDDFVEIDGHRTTWKDLVVNDGSVEITDVCAEILKSIFEGRLSNFFLLADYGAGKSTILRRLQYHLCELKLDEASSYLPVFVALKDFYDTQDLSILLRNSLKDDYLRDVSAEFLWASIRLGRFAFLLDGFDEMTDRSGEQQRQVLFQKLLPILSSPCPAVLTSRPGPFVVRGEIEDIVSRWQNNSLPLRATPHPSNRKAAERYKAIEELRNRLLQGLRDGASLHDQASVPNEEFLAVVKLQPFSTDKIAQYVGRRLRATTTATEKASYDTGDVLAFIDRVYDLSDLASRPLLLRLIVDTILLGGIDVTDPNLEFGPSGLYEMYTTLKLDLDWDKGAVRRGALTRDQRRQLAEMVAVSMYNTSKLDARLSEVLATLPSEAVSSDGVPLSEEEIATDFFTCSFLSIDERQICTFAHKSFMEFFLARTIKNRLVISNPLLQGRLPSAVLYFLGGFAPTDRNVGEKLWKLFIDAPAERVILRRNVLAAYLFTRPIHTSRRIRDAELTDVEYGDLSLSGITIRRSKITNTAIRRFELAIPEWTDVILRECTFSEWLISGGSMSIEIDSSEVGTVSLRNAALSATLLKSVIQSVKAVESTINLLVTDCTIGLLSTERATISVEALRSRITEVKILDSEIRLDVGKTPSGEILKRGVVRRSAVRISVEDRLSSSLFLENCFLFYSQREGDHPLTAIRELPFSQLADSSCVVGIGLSVDAEKLKNRRFGVLGVECQGALDNLDAFKGWGILIILGELASTVFPKNEQHKAISHELLLCTRGWFTRELVAGRALDSLASIIGEDGKIQPKMMEAAVPALKACKAQIAEIFSKQK